MSVYELFLIAVGLSMDAFAVSICKGLAMEKATLKKGVHIGLYFGLFQAGMPLIGFLLGYQFAESIQAFDHWIAFVLLAVIGGKMAWEALKNEGCSDLEETPLNFKAMLPLAIATSIDALAIGVSFAFLQVSIVPAVSFIGVTTFLFSVAGVKIGNIFGTRFKAKAEMVGGVILVLMGCKILFEHLEFLPF